MNGRSFVIFFFCLALAGPLLLFIGKSGGGRSGHPPVFNAHPDFQSALTAAEAADRILVVDMTASWCPPCREMDQTVWVDAELVTYLTNNTIAIQIDIDEQPDLAAEFNIESVPTIIAIDVKRSLELDRKSAFITAPELIVWLQALDQARNFLPPTSVAPPSPTTDRLADQPADQ